MARRLAGGAFGGGFRRRRLAGRGQLLDDLFEATEFALQRFNLRCFGQAALERCDLLLQFGHLLLERGLLGVLFLAQFAQAGVSVTYPSTTTTD